MKNAVAVAVGIGVLVRAAQIALAFPTVDAITTSTASPPALSVTFSHTVGVGTNRLLVVIVHSRTQSSVVSSVPTTMWHWCRQRLAAPVAT